MKVHNRNHPNKRNYVKDEDQTKNTHFKRSTRNWYKEYNLISNKNQFEELKKTVNKSDVISFDLETTDINPLNADIVGISFSFSNNEAYYIPILFPGKVKDYNLDKEIVISDLKAIWEDSENSFIGQNIKYDCLVL